MLILGIETSCDETSIAVVDYNQDQSPKILAEEILSQTKIHIDYGGVVPELAAREHLKNLPLLYRKVLDDANLKIQEVDLIAVTVGPGLKGCLLMGLGFAKGLGAAFKLKLVGVHHIEGHLLAPFLNNLDLTFPYLALVVSGGHTQIVIVKELGKYEIYSETIDDAAGEAFDKSANLLGLAYPGGPELAKLADSINETQYSFPLVMKDQKNFSFSGLKTAISLEIKKQAANLDNPQIKAELAKAIQNSIVENLLIKLKAAIKDTGIQTIVITGGVAANAYLRNSAQNLSSQVFYPDKLHCMDNAAMIALSGGWREQNNLPGLDLNSVSPRLSVQDG